MAGPIPKKPLAVWLLVLSLWPAFAAVSTRQYVSGVVTNTTTTGPVTVNPDHDWRLDVGGSYYGFTYYGPKAPEIGRGTWIVFSRHSLRIHMQIYAVIAGISALVFIPVGIGWSLTRKGTREPV